MIRSNASRLHIRLQYHLRDRLPMWVVYRPTTTDHPGRWLARMHLSLPEPAATEHVVFGATRDEVRAQLPPGLALLQRDPGDDPVIEESWI
jgi:hypothetical protein